MKRNAYLAVSERAWPTLDEIAGVCNALIGGAGEYIDMLVDAERDNWRGRWGEIHLRIFGPKEER